MAAVCNQKHWEVTTNPTYLNSFPLVKMGARHNPIAHGNVVERFNERLDNRGLKTVNQVGMLSRDHLKYVYVVDIVEENCHDDFTFTVGFVNYNNCQKAFTGIYGERVFICSNEMYRGEDIETRRKHTSKLDVILTDKIDGIIEHFFDFQKQRLIEIERLKNCKFTDRMLADSVLAMTRANVVGNTNILNVVREFDQPKYEEFHDRNAWHFQQAFTETLKKIDDPTRRMVATNKMRDIISTVTKIDE